MSQNAIKLWPLGLIVLTGWAMAAKEEHAELATIVVQGDGRALQSVDVDADEMRLRQAQSVGELLRQLPGVQSGHPSALGQRFNIRGLDDRFVNVTINGARQEGYHFHHAGNYGVSPDLLKRIDVAVGSNSITYGAGALGGSIRFETVDASDLLATGEAFGAKAKTGFATNGKEWQKSLTLYGQGAGLDVLGYLNHRSMKDYKGGEAKGQVERIPHDGRLRHYLLKTRLNLSEAQYVNASAERYDNTAETNTLLNFGEGPYQWGQRQYAIDRDTYTMGYGYDAIDHDLINFKAEGYQTTQLSTHMRDVDDNSGYDSKVRTKGIRLRNQARFEVGDVGHDVTVGFEAYDTQSSISSDRYADAVVEQSRAAAVYVEDQIRLHQFTITPGVRWDRYRYDSLNGQLGPDNLPTPDSRRFVKTYTHVAKALGLKYHMAPSALVFANYTELFRGPSGKDLVLGYGHHNPNLKATTGHNLELGFRGGRAGVFSAGDEVELTAKVFQTQYQDFATSVVGRRLDNIPKTRLQGLELSAQHHIGSWTTSVGYAKVNNQVKEGNEQFQKGLTFMPPVGDTLTLGLRQTLPDLGVVWGWQTRLVKSKTTRGYYGRNAYIQDIVKSGYGVSDVHAAWTPRYGWLKGADVVVGIDNVFHKRHTEHANYFFNIAGQAEKGRNLKATLAYAF